MQTMKKGATEMNQIGDFSFTVNPEVAASFHEDGMVILHAGKGSLFSSNMAGARIWRGVEQQMTSSAIADEISSAYQIERTTAFEHTIHFLAELERQTLIRREVVS